jgi:PPK2 family polyphosphate:nucleotide phosphotransferase
MASKTKKNPGPTGEAVRPLLRLPDGPVDLAAIDPRSTPGFDGDKAAGKAALPVVGEPLADLQERLYADGRSDGHRRVLLVLQGMDTSGKGGVLRHSVGLIDPQGVRITSFKAPDAEERRHDFLWRVRRAVPEAGMVGVFDRSHYEDVLIARVRELTTRSAITRRYDAINRFEAELADSGVTILKCMLHVSPEEQKERLLARLDDPTKHWKFNPGDTDERSRWHSYQEAYEIALERCNTPEAPWYVVPSDRKWYRNWAIATMLHEALEELAPAWPPADFDVVGERRRLTEEDPLT